MGKTEFLARLQTGLSALPREEQEERLSFYREMIEDQMEEGLTEEEAVAAAGPVEEIIVQFAGDIPPLPAEKPVAKQRSPWVTVLLILGSPVWLSLLIAALAMVLSLYLSVWAAVISLWAVLLSLWGSALGCAIAGAVFFSRGHIPAGLAALSAVLVCLGLSLLLFKGCQAATAGTVLLGKALIRTAKKKKGGIS